jgi:hypothetical protein
MRKNEYENTSTLLKKLLTVSHAEVKSKLDEEKAEKKQKKSKKSSASREAGGRV